MPTSTPVARTAPRAAGPPRASTLVGVVAVVAIAVMVLGGIHVRLQDPPRTGLTVENATAYEIQVRVEPAEGGSGLGLGTAHAGSTRLFTGVIHQGDRWRFEFAYAGIDAGHVIVTRDDVATGPVKVPRSVEQVLRRSGVPTPP